MKTLYLKYQSVMKESYPSHYNENYKLYKLKDKIEKLYKQRIAFVQPSSKAGDLLYSPDVVEQPFVCEALRFKSLPQKIEWQECADLIRESIKEKQKNTVTCWPPDVASLQKEVNQPPEILMKFLGLWS